jgi:hypothetical protein
MTIFVSRTSARLMILACMAFTSACTHFGPGLPGTPCPVAWAPSQSIDPAAAALRARMQMQIRDEQVHLELITEKRPDELVVVGLARYGGRLFALRQRGTEVEVDVGVAGASSRELERLAIWVMDALHRVYWIPAPDPGDGVQDWTWHGEEVRQGPDADGLRREFSLSGQRDSASDPATRRVSIEYLRAGSESVRSTDSTEPKEKAVSKSRTATIRNPWCGYEARIIQVLAPLDRNA